MSKIFLLGDFHLGLGYPNKLDKWFKTHKEYVDDFLIPLLLSKIEKGDIIVQLGDLFDNRNVLPINILNYAMDLVVKISELAPLHILIGNHDLYTKSASSINSVRLFKHIPNVYIYDSPEKIEYNGKSILMMPYIDSRIEQIKVMNSFKPCNYLFCHSDLNGVKMHLTSSGHRNNDKIDSIEFNGFDKVRTGHIHLRQSVDNITFVGSIFQMDRNDYNDQKGIFVLDTIDDSEEFFENKVSPVFVKVSIKDENDIDKLESLLSSKDYIDISISNSLLISSRKLRRKLELLLEKGSFSTVEYIDDIVKLNEKGEEIIKDEIDGSVLDISIKLDYAEYIREFILNQKYDNDKFKDGVLNEYDEIIEIYNNNFLNNSNV